MSLPVLFAIAWAQGQTPAPAVAQEATNFSKPYDVLEPQRIAVTPLIDGRLDDEEWDELGTAGVGKGYLEWEPGQLHVAMRAPEGHDLVLSIDFKSNGWLIGADNLEVRVSPTGDKPTVKARLLDATKISGPTWVEIPGFALSSDVASRTVDGQTVIELTLRDPGIGLLPVDDASSFSVRMDAPATTEAAFEPFLPRVLTPIKLGMQRSAALPTGLRFNTEGAGKTTAPGEFLRLRLTFNGNNNMKLNRLAIRSEGSAKDGTNKIEVPFPKFDDKGRAFVDYATTVADTVPLGFKVLRAEMSTADGINAMLQSSYRVGPAVDFDMVRVQAPVAGVDRSQRYTFYMRSNGGKRAIGNVSLVVPSPLRVLNKNSWDVQLASNQRSRYTFDLFIPQNTSGTFPVTFKGTINGVPVEQTEYVTIGGV